MSDTPLSSRRCWATTRIPARCARDACALEIRVRLPDVKVPNRAFKRAVRELDFDVTEPR